MHITSVRIVNYKSFLHSNEVRFTSGFNVVVGQNNVGKTALVEALALRSGDKPHRSIRTIPVVGREHNPNSVVNISFYLSKEELLEILRRLQTFHVPAKGENEPVSHFEARFLDAIGQNAIRATWRNNQFTSAYVGDLGVALASGRMRCVQFTMAPSATRPQAGSEFTAMAAKETVGFHIASILRDSIYLFGAERVNVGESRVGNNPSLAPNASNLAQVLNLLQGSNPVRFQRLNEAVSRIFPDIKLVTAPVVSENVARILIWTVNPASERADLAIQLSESGSGIGQVLAMLYVALNSDSPRTVVIDEPQSFLHPGAVRKLFDILKQQPIQHQYIITTHSPTAVTAADAQTLVLVRKPEAESIIETVDMAETNSLRLFLSEVGARLSDVFGADSILWVEGQTEELCFPLILSKIAKRRLYGTAIMGVLQTGDFIKRKHAEVIFDIYKRLSAGRGLLPPAIGFIFDQEGRSRDEQEDLFRKSKGAVHFLPRRMYECYLLNPEAVAAVMSSIEGFRDTPVTAEEVETWLDCHRWEKKYFGRTIPEEERTPDLWLKLVHGAQVLEDLFSEFSEARVNYDKVEYGEALTNWILANSPEDLKEIAELIVGILDSNPDNGLRPKNGQER